VGNWVEWVGIFRPSLDGALRCAEAEIFHWPRWQWGRSSRRRRSKSAETLGRGESSESQGHGGHGKLDFQVYLRGFSVSWDHQKNSWLLGPGIGSSTRDLCCRACGGPKDFEDDFVCWKNVQKWTDCSDARLQDSRHGHYDHAAFGCFELVVQISSKYILLVKQVTGIRIYKHIRREMDGSMDR
jgi:hypothetical protein